jgi:hypothetical protein
MNIRKLLRRKPGGAVLHHPLEPTPRTVVLVAGFEETRRVRVFPDGWGEAAERFEATSVAGPLKALRQLARHEVELKHAIIVFTYEPGERLSDADRDWLWNMFGVPVFEQVFSEDHTLLAFECEAHEGLHVVKQASGWELDDLLCACGCKLPKLANVAPVAQLRVMAVMA